jgi:tyrosinase
LPFSRSVADETSSDLCANSFRIQQAIQKKAVTIADKYTVNKASFQKAALELRQPYWDWAAKAIPPDEVISKARVTIIKPDGSKGLVDNPLLKYKFPNRKESIFPWPYSQWKTTMRTPTNLGPTATTDVGELKEWASP